ncbi:MAG: hypothetical protein ACM3NW_00730 [Syntrophomonadaceae bacterium]
MKRLTLIPGLILTALGGAALAGAEQNASGLHPRMGFALRGMEKCIAGADISSNARASAQAALASGKDVLKADGAALKAAHEKMQFDIANGADKAVVGQDAIDADAAKTKIHTDAKTIHDQVLGALSPDEQAAVEACLSAHAGAWKRGHKPAPPTE